MLVEFYNHGVSSTSIDTDFTRHSTVRADAEKRPRPTPRPYYNCAQYFAVQLTFAFRLCLLLKSGRCLCMLWT